VFRPRYQETGERILKKIRERHGDYYSEISLEPLGERHCEALIDNLLDVKGLPSPVRDLIIRRAEGNPFFIEEVARSFIDDGIVMVRDGRFAVTEKIDSVNIPETISEILMARLDKLDEGTRALLKTASVIGRSFFYKILADVAKSVGEIDEKLDYLKEVQLVLERWRMEEIEYLFKHALVQEVTYESILLQKRKDLHLKIAGSIESIFSGRLHEFYGLLALHYSRGENLDKTEEYLVKAGEEALKAAASIEALNYYQEALRLYLKKHGDAGDPETIAHLEKNIAIALHNKGHMAEAVEHFDKALEYWGEKRLKNKMTMLLNLVADLFSIIKQLYFPSKKAKRVPPPGMSDIVDITHKRATALATVDNYRMFVDSIGLLRKLGKLDITKVAKGPSMYIQGCALFSFSGVSFKIGKKLLDYPKDYMSSSDKKSIIDYKFGELMYGILSGNWTREITYDESMIEDCVKIGDPYSAIVYLIWSGILQAEQGNFGSAQTCVEKLREIGEMFDNDYARGRIYIVSSRLLLKCRRLHEAQCEVDEGISFSDRIGQSLNLLNFLGIKANTQILLGDLDGAENSLQQAQQNISRERRIFPWHFSSYRLSQFLYSIYKLEEAIEANDKENTNKFQRKAYKLGEASLKNASKYAPNRTETLKLMGVYYWLTGRQKKALNWWGKALETAYRLRARTELSRTYLEIGKRLHEEKSKFQEWNGIHADKYLEKAERLFRKMGLERDLRDLNRIRQLPMENGLDRYIVIEPDNQS
jgi:tetratricopeptide (TPR) repeat protein